jgi:hypothetical protein
MKNFTTGILIVAFVMVHSLASAQFKEGESFADGSFYVNLFDNKMKNTDIGLNRYSHNINLSLGRFKSSTFATGWALSHNLITQNLKNYDIDPKSLQTLGFGVSRFWEFYKPLNDKFSLYVRPSIGLSYKLDNTYESSSSVILSETRRHSFSLGASVSGGIAWRLAPKWAIYGGFAFTNPLDITFGFAKNRNVADMRPDGQFPQTNSRGFSYRFAPELSSGSIGLGFRYFY